MWVLRMLRSGRSTEGLHRSRPESVIILRISWLDRGLAIRHVRPPGFNKVTGQLNTVVWRFQWEEGRDEDVWRKHPLADVVDSIDDELTINAPPFPDKKKQNWRRYRWHQMWQDGLDGKFSKKDELCHVVMLKEMEEEYERRLKLEEGELEQSKDKNAEAGSDDGARNEADEMEEGTPTETSSS